MRNIHPKIILHIYFYEEIKQTMKLKKKLGISDKQYCYCYKNRSSLWMKYKFYIRWGSRESLHLLHHFHSPMADFSRSCNVYFLKCSCICQYMLQEFCFSFINPVEEGHIHAFEPLHCTLCHFFLSQGMCTCTRTLLKHQTWERKRKVNYKKNLYINIWITIKRWKMRHTVIRSLSMLGKRLIKSSTYVTQSTLAKIKFLKFKILMLSSVNWGSGTVKD